MASFLKWSNATVAPDVSGRQAEKHHMMQDLFDIVDGDGEMIFIVGGEADGPVSESVSLSDPTSLSSGIIGGERYVLKKGMDPFHIPRRTWHQWSTKGTVSYRVLKIPAA